MTCFISARAHVQLAKKKDTRVYANGRQSLIYSRRSTSLCLSTRSKAYPTAHPTHSDNHPSLHWYLAIICNPEFVLQPPPPSTTTVSSVQTRKRKRDSDALEQESSTTLPEPSDRAHDSPTATADDETSVENILDGYNVPQTTANGSTDDLSMHLPEEESLFDDFGGELQYPDSDGVPGESSTDLAGTSRDRSEPIMIDDDAMDVDDPNEASTSAVPCTSFYASGSKATKEPEDVSMSPEVPWNGLSTAPVNTDVPDLDLENEEPVVVTETSDYRSDK